MSSLHIRSLGGAPASIWALSASQLRDLTASLSPTPGGGSISVFTATLGLALVHKGTSISFKRAGDDMGRREDLSRLCENVTAALALISGLADEDCQSFQEYVAARSLPRTTEEQKVLRDVAMQVAILRATRVPLASASSIYGALGHAEMALRLSDRHLLSDVFGGALIMQAASKAVLLAVKANVSLLTDAGVRAEIEGDLLELERLSSARSESVTRAYEARMADSKDFAGQ